MVQSDQIDCWVPFAREAVAGRKTFVLTHSQIPTSAYASTPECGAALVSALGLRLVPVGGGRWGGVHSLRRRLAIACGRNWKCSGFVPETFSAKKKCSVSKT